MPDTGNETGNAIDNSVQKEYAEAARRAYGRTKDDTDTSKPPPAAAPPVNK